MSQEYIIDYIFSVIVSIFFKLQKEVGDVNKKVDSYTRKLIEDMMVEKGEKVVIPFVLGEVERGDMTDFYLGIENVYNNPHTFKVLVAYQGTEAPTTIPVFMQENDQMTIDPHERGVIRLNFFGTKEARSQQYTFLITICYDNEHATDINTDLNECTTDFPNYYPPKQMVYLTVK